MYNFNEFSRLKDRTNYLFDRTKLDEGALKASSSFMKKVEKVTSTFSTSKSLAIGSTLGNDNVA